MTRKIFGLLAIIAAVFIGVVGVSGPALAAYPPNPGPPVVSTTTPDAGAPFTVSKGEGSFDAGSTVSIEYCMLYSDGSAATQGCVTVVTGNASSNGSFSGTVAIPQCGSYEVRMVGMLGGASKSYATTVNVKTANGGACGTAGPELPHTGGGNTMTIAIVGGALVIAGGAAVVVARRRERSVR
jgi:LPXTG-motif cell wall-anchored protein